MHSTTYTTFCAPPLPAPIFFSRAFMRACTLDASMPNERQVAAYSTQSDKVINSGEGGFVVTSDDEVAAKAIFLSGAYERRFGEDKNYSNRCVGVYLYNISLCSYGFG